MPRIYLDNAATTWPKPESVYAAVDAYQRENGAPAGRSAYADATESERLVADARRRVATLIGAEDPRRLLFTANGTDSLNIVLHGMLHSGDHVLTTTLEHNSVLRPLRHLEEKGVEVTRVEGDEEGRISPKSIQKALRPHTRLVVMIHASNVTGALQPVEEVAQIARRASVPLLVDAAQTLGQVPINVKQMGIDLLAAPGHKGLLAPLGVGVLYMAEGLEDRIESIRQGGTGSVSEEDRQPSTLPDKYEAGNHNVPALAGLSASAAWLAQQGIETIGEHHRNLTSRLIEGLASIEGVTLFGPCHAERQVGLVSFNLAGYDPQELAALLDSAYQIQVRAGLHCAPLVHRSLGTANMGGTVRASFGPFTTDDQIDAVITALREIKSVG